MQTTKLPYDPSTFGLDIGGLPYSHSLQPDGSSVFEVFGSLTNSLYGDHDSDYDGFTGVHPEPQTSHWGNPNPILPELGSFESFFSCSAGPLYPSPSYSDRTSYYGEQDSWSYTGQHFSTTLPPVEGDVSAACPMLASPTSSSVYSDQDTTPSPLQLNEFSNVFDYDFSTALPSESPASSPGMPHPGFLPSSLSRRRSPPCSAPRSPRHLDLVDFTSPKSREHSPSQLDADSKRKFPCLILGCARRFTSQYTLKVHMEAHRPKPRASFPCTLGCSEKFSRQHDRLRHEVAKHGKICEFLCHDCGRFFSTNKTLGNHKCPAAQGGTRWVNV